MLSHTGKQAIYWEILKNSMTRKELFINTNRLKLRYGSLADIHVCEKWVRKLGNGWGAVHLCANTSPILQNSSEGWIITVVWQPAVKKKFAGGWYLLPTWHLKKSAEFSFIDFFLAQWCRLLPLSLFTLSISFSVLCAYVLSVQDGKLICWISAQDRTK